MRIYSLVILLTLSLRLLAQDYPSALVQKECIVLDLSESVEEQNSHFVYRWDFGDGTQSYGITAEHCYDSIGIFKATLSILDPVSTKNFEEEFVKTIRIVPAVELAVDVIKDSDSFSLKASLIGYEGEAQFYWSYADQYLIGQELSHIPAKPGDKLRVLTNFNFRGEEIFLAKEITIEKTL